MIVFMYDLLTVILISLVRLEDFKPWPNSGMTVIPVTLPISSLRQQTSKALHICTIQDSTLACCLLPSPVTRHYTIVQSVQRLIVRVCRLIVRVCSKLQCFLQFCDTPILRPRLISISASPGTVKWSFKLIFLWIMIMFMFSVFFFIVGCIITCICVQTRAKIWLKSPKG